MHSLDIIICSIGEVFFNQVI